MSDQVTEGQEPSGATPTDPLAYWIAVGALGVALVAFLIGAAVIAAGGKPVPTQYWSTGSGIAGAIIGIVAPAPTRRGHNRRQGWFMDALGAVAEGIEDLWNNRAVIILSTVFGVSLAFAISHNSAPLETVAAAAGGALVGLLAPPPSQHLGGR